MDELVTWLRRRIAERKYLAEHAIELGSFAEWEERSSGVLVTGDGTDSDPWRGTWVTGDSSVTRLMEANDPRDTTARCEAELAILDDHGSDGKPKYPECRCCGVEHFPCRTVRLLGFGYRFRPGYRQEWKP